MSAFFQVATIAILIVAALVVGGVMPLDAVTRYLPPGLLEASPFRQRPLETAEGPARAEAPGGYARAESRSATAGRRESRSDEEAERRRGAQREARQAAAADGGGCASTARINALAARYDSWSAADLRLIACREVRQGFTSDQLIASLGRPLRRVDSAATRVWVYRDMRVVVQNDQVIAIHSN